MTDAPEKLPLPEFREILDAMTDFVLVKGPRSHIAWANRAFLEYYGMTNAELTALVDGPQADPDDTVQYVRDDHRVFTTGATLDIPSEPVTAHDGDVGYFRTIKSVIRDAEGRITHTVGVSRPVEASAEATGTRQARKDALEGYRALVRSLPMPMIMCDASLRILQHSQAWTTFAGLHVADDEDYTARFEAVLPAAEMMRATIAKDGESRREGVVAQPSGRPARVVNVQARAWRLPDGTVGGVVLMAQDVTEQVRTTEQLARANDELQQFSYRASHDLKGPLRTGVGLLDMVDAHIQAGRPDDARAVLGRAQRKLSGLSRLVEDLLRLARADVDAMQVGPVSLSALVAESLEFLSEDLTAAGLEASVELAVDGVRSDAVRLRQMLDNLISNAAKYHDPTRSDRRLIVRSGALEGGVFLEVEDNGIGFERPEDAFRSFAREARSASPGSGLGLAIVLKHAERLGGSVQISSPSIPTRVRIELPLDTTAG